MTRIRGQALVMAALFLLVLVLMVMATMSLAHLTHQKMEIQVASDTAAYSEAVATARAYNSVALLNRAQLATMVTLAGVDSAVSFAGSYRAALNATWYAYWNEFDYEYCDGTERPSGASFPQLMCEGYRLTTVDNCKKARRGEDAFDRNWCYGESCRVRLYITGYGAYGQAGNDYLPTARLPVIYVEFERLRSEIWQVLDDAAGLQARSVQTEAASYADLQGGALAKARGELRNFARDSIGVVGATANPGAKDVAEREFNDGTGGGISDNGIDAAMGSRAHTFITQRKDGQRAIQAAIRRVLTPAGAGNEVTINAMRGNGYFATSKIHGARPATSFAAWGDEECSVTVNYAGPDAQIGNPGAGHTLRFEGWVGSTDRQNTTDSHNWCPEDFEPDDDPPDERHTMLPHAVPPNGLPDPCAASSCIWPSFIDTNQANLADPADVFGQPKLLAAATKELAGQNKPWNMFLTYHFVPGGQGATTNFRAKHAVAGVQPELQSVSAAMAYYHRPGHWKEAPNFFNPYWRATLVRANIDNTWKGDLLRSVSPSNGAAIDALDGAGYRGVP